MIKLLKIANYLSGWALVAWAFVLITDMMFDFGIIDSKWSLPFTIGLIIVFLISHLLVNNKN